MHLNEIWWLGVEMLYSIEYMVLNAQVW
jgi:hypothetical protein